MQFAILETELDSDLLDGLIESGYPIEKVEKNGTYIYRTPAMVSQSSCVGELTQRYANGLLTMDIPVGQKKRGKYKSKDIIVDFDERKIDVRGEIFALRRTEFILLEMFITHPHVSYSRPSLLFNLEQNFNHSIQDNTLTVHISSLRKLVGKDYIKTHKTLGYYWNYDVENIG